MKLFRAILAGIAGALAMSGAMFVMRSFGLTISLEALLGSMFAPNTNWSPWTIGFVLHLLIGATVAIAYAIAFEMAVQRSGILIGAGFGLAHGLMAGLFMSAIPAMNPLDPASMSAPGPFLSYMRFGPPLFLAVHCIYGMVVGLVYGPPLQKPHLTPGHPA